MRLLVVDDDSDVRESLVEELSESYQVESVEGGQAAIQALGKGRYDAVISDLRMPDLDGLSVLEYARHRDPEVIRILLTGYSDEAAHRATLLPGAPYKIGKPWHDEIEVTLRRAFEGRDSRRRLVESLTSTLDLLALDDELAAQEGVVGVARVLTRHMSHIDGVMRATVDVEIDGRPHVLSHYEDANVADRIAEWKLDELLNGDGARALIEGESVNAQRIAHVLLQHARRWAGQDPVSLLARRASVDPSAQQQLLALARRAAVGTMAASLHHELASLLNVVVFGLDYLGEVVRSHAEDEDQIASLEQALQASRRAVSLFAAIRSFVHQGSSSASRERVAVSDLIEQAVTLSCAKALQRCRVVAAEVADAYLAGSAPLLVQVLVNLLRNAREASPEHGTIDLEATVEGGWVVLAVTDDGPGVSVENEGRLFEPFFTTKGPTDGTGLGLAFAAHTVAAHGGKITYRHRPGRGACFIVRLPLA